MTAELFSNETVETHEHSDGYCIIVCEYCGVTMPNHHWSCKQEGYLLCEECFHSYIDGEIN